jgi:hypothetical protein
MSNATATARPLSTLEVTAAGALLGVIYTLSPLTVLFMAVLGVVVWRTGLALGRRERQWFFGVVAVAVALRLLAIAGLFVFADPDKPFATFFGDEELFKSRSIWLRNIGLGVPISSADFIYAVEETGKSQYLFFLAYLEALVGDAPYGIHVLNTVLFVIGVVTMYRLVRSRLGRLAALGGLTFMLFLPSLFAWSISALKEPVYCLVAMIELVCVIQLVRSPTWSRRLLALVGIVATALLLEGLRKGGILVTTIGTAAGLISAAIVSRPRLLLAAIPVLPIVFAVTLQAPAVRDRALSVLRDAAVYHAGHVYTIGYSYKTLDEWYYIDPPSIRAMPIGDAAAFVARAVVAYFVQPVPWTIESRSVLGFIPEQMVWLSMVAFVPIGILAGLRRDALLTCVIAAHACAMIMMVALTSGNIGTLIRHRGLAVLYLAWLSALGVHQVLAWCAPGARLRRFTGTSLSEPLTNTPIHGTR